MVKYKIIYLIQAHTNVNIINALISQLAHPEVLIYIHLDAKCKIKASEILSTGICIKNNIKVYWGNFSQVMACIQSLKEILAQNVSFNHIVYLSAQDYPVKSNTDLLKTFTPGKDYLNNYEVSTLTWNANDRYEKYNYIGNNFFLNAYSKSLRMFNKLTKRKRKMPYNLQPYIGSQWWILSEESVKYVLKYIDAHPKLISFFNFVSCADELFFQTILLNSDRSPHIINKNFRYIVFLPNTKSPEIITEKDLPAIKAGDYCFCRKIDSPQSDGLIALLKHQTNYH